MGMKIAVISDYHIVRKAFAGLLKDVRPETTLSDSESIKNYKVSYPDVTPDIIFTMIEKGESHRDVNRNFLSFAKLWYPGALIVVYTGDLDRESVRDYLSSGVKGYLHKTASQNDLELCIEKILQGDTYIDSEILCELLISKRRVKIR